VVKEGLTEEESMEEELPQMLEMVLEVEVGELLVLPQGLVLILPQRLVLVLLEMTEERSNFEDYWFYSLSGRRKRRFNSIRNTSPFR
jgi:hypothetical protein